jgi:predicted regulator of Ras-like GTPase activity (Roadblock/LC7/MglB family)
MTYVESPEQSAWMIADIVGLPGVKHAIVYSSDGLLLVRSEQLDKDSADRLAASCSGLQSLGRSVGREFGEDSGAVRQQMIEFDGGFVFLRSAEGAHLAVVAGPVVDPKLVGSRMQAQVLKIGAANLRSPRRQEAAQ